MYFSKRILPDYLGEDFFKSSHPCIKFENYKPENNNAEIKYKVRATTHTRASGWWRAAAWLLEKSHPHLYGKQAGKVGEQALEEQRIELVQILQNEIDNPELIDRIVDRLHQFDEAKLSQVEEATTAKEQPTKEPRQVEELERAAMIDDLLAQRDNEGGERISASR